MGLFRHEDGRCYHVEVKPGDVSANIIACGSPERVESIAQRLENPRLLSKHRGFLCYQGSYKGLAVTAVCCGIGPASTVVTLPEIIESVDSRAKNVNILRLGTCGSLQSYVHVGDIVVSKGAVRDEGTSPKIAPIEYPATASLRLSLASLAAAKDAGMKINQNLWYGVHHVKDELYATESPADFPLAESRHRTMLAYKRMGVLATEMEYSVFAILVDYYNHKFRREGKQQNIATGCILLSVSDYHETEKQAADTVAFKVFDPQIAISIALETFVHSQHWIEGKTKISDHVGPDIIAAI